MNSESLAKTILLSFISLMLVLTATAHASPGFMTPPFDDPEVRLQQGWFYDSPGPLRCRPEDRDHSPFCHYGLDYVKGEVDKPATWVPFEVAAVADGKALYRPAGSKTWGNYVITTHAVGGITYYTVNAHLDSSPLPPRKWVPITRGTPIGTSGKSGLANGVVHLHLEVYEGSLKKDDRVDPYDIYDTKALYPPHGVCGEHHLWSECPPSDLPIAGGTYFDGNFGLIGTSFLFDPSSSLGSLNSVDITGPPGWHNDASFQCFRYQPPGAAPERSMCWDVNTPPVTGQYSAQAEVGNELLEARLSIDTASWLEPPAITKLSVLPGQVQVEWTATSQARSFLVRVNPVPFSGVTGEVVVPGEERGTTLTGLSLAGGAQYQAVVFAFSRDVRTPESVLNPFNIGAHGVVFTAPRSGPGYSEIPPE